MPENLSLVNDEADAFDDFADEPLLSIVDHDTTYRDQSIAEPMTKSEAQRSIQRAKSAARQSKEHLAVLRWELFHQRERCAWEVLGFSSFADFASRTYGYKKAYAYQLADAAQTERSLSAIADLDYQPLREYSLRVLGTVSEEHRAAVYKKAREIAGTTHPTANQITEAGRKLGVTPPKKYAPNGRYGKATTIFHSERPANVFNRNETKRTTADFIGFSSDFYSITIDVMLNNETITVCIPVTDRQLNTVAGELAKASTDPQHFERIRQEAASRRQDRVA